MTNQLKHHFLRLSGIKRIIYIDIGTYEIRISIVRKKRCFEVLETKVIPADTNAEDLKNTIEKTVDVSGRRKTGVIVSVHNYMVHTVSIPVEESDIDEWLWENTPELFPYKGSENDYSVIFQECARDEDAKYYYVVISRKKDIEYIESLISYAGCVYSAIIPTELTVLTMNSLDIDRNILFIRINKHEVRYAFMDVTKKVIKGELLIPASDENASQELFNDMLTDILDHIKTEYGNNLNLDIQIIIDNNSSISTGENGIDGFLKGRSSLHGIHSFDIVKNTRSVATSLAEFVYKHYDRIVDLQSETYARVVRKKLEEKIVLRGVLFTAFVMLSLLVAMEIIENYYRHHMEVNKQELVDINSTRGLIASLEDENLLLRRNLSAIQDVKYNRMPISYVMNKIPEYLPATSWSTGILIERKKEDGLLIEINGVAPGQNYIANILQRMESDSLLQTTDLMFANAMPQRELNRIYNINRNNYIRYHITAKYHAY